MPAELEADRAYALSLVQVHEQKIRVLMESRARRYARISRDLLSLLTGTKKSSLQTFEEYLKIARSRARKMVDSRSASPLLGTSLAGDQDELRHAEALSRSVQDSALYRIIRDRFRSSPTGQLGLDDTVVEAAKRALSQERPEQPRNVLVSTSHALEDLRFPARMTASPHHAALMRDRPLVSVIMPTHNRARLLEAAVESVVAQTYGSWELLIVDDHSSDETSNVGSQFAAADPRIRFLTNAGRGVAAARNTGIANSRGEFIAYLDDDNVWTAEYLELMLAHMRMEASDFAYSSMRLTDQNGAVRYRGRHFSHADLLIQNYIDMNVVVHRRDLLERSGLFDETLERTVDWEFIIRATKAGRVSWAEFIGVDYSDDATRVDRLTVAKRYAWRFHVMNRHFVDWASDPGGDEIPVTIVVNAHGDIDEVEGTLAQLLENAPEGGFELLAVDNRLSDEVAPRLLLWSELIPELRVVHTPLHVGLALGRNFAAQFARGRVLVFAAVGVQLRPDWLASLLSELDGVETGAVQPVLRNGWGGVYSTGYDWVGRASEVPEVITRIPSRSAGGATRAAAVCSQCMAIRRADFVALRGFEPLYGEELGDIDLGFRLREKLGKISAVVPTADVVFTPRKKSVADTDPDSRAEFLRTWQDRMQKFRQEVRKDSRGHVAESGSPDEAGSGPTAVGRQPIHVRERRLRFSIKICCPSESVKLQWGDYHFGRSLQKELVKLGHGCRIDMAPDWNDAGPDDDIVLLLRGLYHYKPRPTAVNLMWLISHPMRVKAEQLTSFDHVFVASDTFARHLAAETPVPVSVLMQCTDPELFYPASEMPAGERIIFVGNSRNVRRPVIAAASDEGLPVEVYGGGWAGFCRPDMVKADSIPNEQVGDLYRSAAVVLNDHWEDMRVNGFVSNRLFDACACGIPVVSDYVAGLEVFDGLVSVLEPGEPLAPLVNAVLHDAPALRRRRLDLAARIAAEHSFAARAARILENSREVLRLMA